MADKRISELEAITGANTAADDFFLVVDTSGAVTKKISRAELNNAIERDVLSLVNIDGGTIDGTVIGGSSAAAGTFTTFTSNGIADNASSTALTITTSQNVGIGTSSADRLFEVEEASGDAWMRLRASDTGGGADTIFENLVADNGQNNYIYFGDLDDTNIGMIRYNHASDFMSFTTNTAERMRLTSSGSLGLGASAPNAKLEVNSGALGTSDGNQLEQARFTSTNVNGSYLRIFTERDGAGSDWTTAFTRIQQRIDATDQGYIQFNGADNTYGISFGRGNTRYMLVDGSGNVGIGVSTIDTALGTKLHVAGTIRTDTGSANANPAIVFDHDNFADADANYIMLDRASEAMRFNVNASERIRLDSSGRLGVNISAPATRLHVLDGTSSLRFRQNGTVAETLTIGPNGGDAAVYLGDATDTVRAGLYYDTSENDLQIRGYNNSTRILINSAGNVAIGTTVVSNKLSLPIGQTVNIGATAGTAHQAGNVGSVGLTITDGGNANGVRVHNTHNGTYSSSDIRFTTGKGGVTSGLERMRVTNTGNVGIQVSNPATALDCTNGYVRSERVQGGYGNASGNFHIDSKTGTAGVAYLNWFQGTGGVNVGNGASGYGTIRAAAFTVSSDRRLKENISYFDRGLAEILQLKPATFDFINGENNQKGFIAQDVETVIPEAVGTTTMSDSNGNVDETDTYLTINNSAIIPYLVAAIKEQQTIIESLEARVAALETA